MSYKTLGELLGGNQHCASLLRIPSECTTFSVAGLLSPAAAALFSVAGLLSPAIASECTTFSVAGLLSPADVGILRHTPLPQLFTNRAPEASQSRRWNPEAPTLFTWDRAPQSLWGARSHVNNVGA